MNILPKKRWHVRTKDNIARVRRDEAQAAEEEAQRVLRAKLAEQEARTALLRTRARQKYDGGHGMGEEEAASAPPSRSDPGTTTTTTTTTTTHVADIYTAEGNINFFKDLEEGKRTDGKNEEYEKEKKEEQEKYEKKIGYLTYLGQDSIEAQGKKAWYEDPAGRTTYRGDEGEEGEVNEVGLKSKDKLDPIHDIIKYGGIKPVKKVLGIPKLKRVDEDVQITQKQKIGTTKQMQQSKSTADKRRKYKHKESKKKKKKKKSKKRRSDDEDNHKEKQDGHKHRDRKRRRDDRSDEDNASTKRRKTSSHKSQSREKEQERKRYYSTTSSSSSSYESSEDEEAIQEKKKKLEILRAERLMREAEERKRANRLLAGKKPDGSDEQPQQPTIQQKYHSQFNPHIARQNQEERPLEVGVKYWLQ